MSSQSLIVSGTRLFAFLSKEDWSVVFVFFFVVAAALLHLDNAVLDDGGAAAVGQGVEAHVRVVELGRGDLGRRWEK